MFRMLKLNPPHGWRAVMWELVIVTLGVLIALAVQQWAENRSWDARTRLASAAIKRELADHYKWSVEWRVATPCLTAQIDRLKQRVQDSGARLEPAPTHTNPYTGKFVLRMPTKDYLSNAWQSAISDGVTSHLDDQTRDRLSAHYAIVQILVPMTWQNNNDAHILLGLGRPIPLDPTVRYSMLRTLDEIGGRIAIMDFLTAELIGHVQKLDMVPPAATVQSEVASRGIFRFCQENHLPIRSFEKAMSGESN